MFADFLPRSFVLSVPGAGAPRPNKYVTAVTLPAPPAAVFRLLADIEALPHWAPEFCERIDLAGGGWRALTVAGEFACELAAEDAAGTVDLRLDPLAGGPALLVPLRVAALPDGGTLVSLTLTQAPGQPWAQFDRQRRSLLAALWSLAGRFADAEPGAERLPARRGGRRLTGLRLLRRGS